MSVQITDDASATLTFPLSRYSERLGLGYQIFLTCNSGSLMTSFVLLLCYTVSTSTYHRVRPSLFVSCLPSRASNKGFPNITP